MDVKSKVSLLLQLFTKSKLRNGTKTFLEPTFSLFIVKFKKLGFSAPLNVFLLTLTLTSFLALPNSNPNYNSNPNLKEKHLFGKVNWRHFWASVQIIPINISAKELDLNPLPHLLLIIDVLRKSFDSMALRTSSFVRTFMSLCLSYHYPNTERFCLHVFQQTGPPRLVDCLAPRWGRAFLLPLREHSRVVDICLSWLLNFQGSPQGRLENGINRRILKANLSWSLTWTKFCQLIASLSVVQP